ncbi:MAG: hypothetical protein GTO42_02745 [Candidatus Latescibacteria bacterium]|nr:hypothetical protein [Candidatus Latescibacterota bacterium]NIO01056.1 hypothetical protein [Candidatus Latescibacterota bacterium]NIO27455.1 hypothetical protein [Candidatus Latescibacterota bacterium]NIO54977.1 hypothetical protein [Candidatus Latescibacterota bacterium]NIT01066.1 hypothetical protein [Candidatus Latescibacterota bacterium]
MLGHPSWEAGGRFEQKPVNAEIPLEEGEEILQIAASPLLVLLGSSNDEQAVSRNDHGEIRATVHNRLLGRRPLALPELLNP